MKKAFKQILILTAVVSITTFSSCRFNCKRGSGKVVTENRKVSDFTKVDISGGYKVRLVQDSSLNVSISADDNLMKYIQTGVSGGKLRIKSKKNLCSSGEITLTIGVRNLEEIDASGAVEVSSNSRINTGDLHFDLSGATKIDMDINAKNVSTDGSGATQIYLKGQAASHNIELSGTGKVEALDFVVGKYSIETSGASHCKINALTSLDVNTSGASEIEYRGTPSINSKKSGASSIKKVD
jgi:hypothetical protein